MSQEAKQCENFSHNFPLSSLYASHGFRSNPQHSITMANLLSPHAGLLPYWKILVRPFKVDSFFFSTATNLAIKIQNFAFINTVGCYRSRKHALRTHQGPSPASQITDFGARMLGTWTALSCIIRIYAAYRIHSIDVYVLATCTYIIALLHFFLASWYTGP